jgi:CopG family nickel-responsive transcriptional regulator
VVARSGKLVRFGVSVEHGLIRRFDSLIAEKGYGSRSEALRDLIRKELASKRASSGEEVIGLVGILYEHSHRGLLERITSAQHHAGANAISSLHLHLDRDTCLEMVVLRSQAARLQEFRDKLASFKGVLTADLTLFPKP